MGDARSFRWVAMAEVLDHVYFIGTWANKNLERYSSWHVLDLTSFGETTVQVLGRVETSLLLRLGVLDAAFQVLFTDGTWRNVYAASDSSSNSKSDIGKPKALFAPGVPEASLHYDGRLRKWLMLRSHSPPQSLSLFCANAHTPFVVVVVQPANPGRQNSDVLGRDAAGRLGLRVHSVGIADILLGGQQDEGSYLVRRKGPPGDGDCG